MNRLSPGRLIPGESRRWGEEANNFHPLFTVDSTYPEGVFTGVHIYYVGKWEGVGPWNTRVFGPCEMGTSG
jgi:hypothetical protein